MVYPVGVWTKDPEGYAAGAYLYNGPILFPAGIDPDSTQTVVCVFGPAGGRANFPPVQAGTPGPPPELSMGGVTTLTPGASVTADLIQTSPGAPGIASQYDLYLGVPAGVAGTAAANTLISPQPADLEGTPGLNKMIGYDATGLKAQWQPVPYLTVFNVPQASIGTTGTSAGQTRSLTYITIPSQPYNYIPIVLGADATITGTANTQVDLVARLGGSPNTQTGAQIARGRGPSGAVIGANPWTNQIVPNFTSLLTGGYAQVSAGTTATIYLNTEQQASTPDLYSTDTASFTIGALAVKN